MMNPLVRILFSAATLGLVVLFGILLPQNPLAWGCLIVMALIYQAMVWSSLDWWTPARYALAVSLMIALAGTLRFPGLCGSDIPCGLLLVPLVLLLAREQRDRRRFATLLAVVTMAAALVLAWGVSYILPLLAVVIALYMSVRAINIYKEAYRLSEQNVEALQAAHQELQETYAALQEATVHSVRYAALSERARLAREIHDGLGHQLTSLIVQLQALEIMLPNDPAQAAKAVPGMLEVARKAMAEVRQAIETWREDESGAGLVALQSLVSQFAAIAPIAPEFLHDSDLSDWSQELSVALYRILQEALTNILRHAEATAATIRVQEDDHQVTLTVSDNGCFTESKPIVPGYGIQGIMERAQALGGDCRISQNQPHGLKLQVSLPIKPSQATPARAETNI